METAIVNTDYTCSFTVNRDPKEVFECLTSLLPEWWTKDIEGSSRKQGDTFTVHFGATYKTMKITEAIPYETIVWKCLESYIDLPGLKKKNEWKDTKIVWEILADGPAAKIIMTHIGLNAGIECFTVCEKGWGFFLHESLYKLLAAGKGQPYTKS